MKHNDKHHGQDDWSHVRLAASRAVRALVAALSCAADRDRYYDALLPPMCLNRYFEAEGVRYYSQDTWKLCVQEGGPAVIAQHIGAVVGFYVAVAEVLAACRFMVNKKCVSLLVLVVEL